jgi:hypothetical protein
MQIGEILTNVRAELVEPVAGFWTDAELLRIANRGEADYVRRTRCLEGKYLLSTVNGQAEYPLPVNWTSSKAIFYNDPASDGTPNWYRLEPTSLEKMAQENQNFLSTATTSRTKPSKYWVWERSINLFPVPDTDGDSNVTMFFKAKPTPLVTTTDSISIDESLSDAIEAYILWRAWSKEKEYDLATEQASRYADLVREGRKWVKLQTGDKVWQIDVRSPVPFSQLRGNPRFNPLA